MVKQAVTPPMQEQIEQRIANSIQGLDRAQIQDASSYVRTLPPSMNNFEKMQSLVEHLRSLLHSSGFSPAPGQRLSQSIQRLTESQLCTLISAPIQYGENEAPIAGGSLIAPTPLIQHLAQLLNQLPELVRDDTMRYLATRSRVQHLFPGPANIIRAAVEYLSTLRPTSVITATTNGLNNLVTNASNPPAREVTQYGENDAPIIR